MAKEFIRPEFVSDSSPEAILERMRENLPSDIDVMPGTIAYDLVMPTALEKSELLNFHLVRTLMLMFPQFAWGEWLDLHGEQVGVRRQKPNFASGYVTVQGIAGTLIPEGTIFATPATDTEPSLTFAADTEAGIGADGRVTIPVTAQNSGTKSNVDAGSIVLLMRPKKGVVQVYNEAPITGGTGEETDESYYVRIALEYGSEGKSYIGNDQDYIRWAKSVDGIGDCIVDPAWAGPGTVKLILVDANGVPANDRLQQAVYDFIVSPNDRSKRLLPTGCAELTVAAAETKAISYVCSGLVMAESTSLEVVEKEFREAVRAVYAEAQKDQVLRYNRVRGLLTQLSGVSDFSEFTMNGGMENLYLDRGEYAETAQIEFTA